MAVPLRQGTCLPVPDFLIRSQPHPATSDSPAEYCRIELYVGSPTVDDGSQGSTPKPHRRRRNPREVTASVATALRDVPTCSVVGTSDGLLAVKTIRSELSDDPPLRAVEVAVLLGISGVGLLDRHPLVLLDEHLLGLVDADGLQEPGTEPCPEPGGAERLVGGVHREIQEPQAVAAHRLSNPASKAATAGGDDLVKSGPNMTKADQGEVLASLPGSKSVARTEGADRNLGRPEILQRAYEELRGLERRPVRTRPAVRLSGRFLLLRLHIGVASRSSKGICVAECLRPILQ